MKKKTKYDDTDLNQAIWLLQQNGFRVEREWFNKEHRLRGYISGKDVRSACDTLMKWWNQEPKKYGCVHYDMFQYDGMVYSIVFGLWGDEDDEQICRKIARQPVNSGMQCDFDVDWNMPLWLDKEGKATGDVWDSLDRVWDPRVFITTKGLGPVWNCHASQANQWILDVYQKVLEGEVR